MAHPESALHLAAPSACGEELLRSFARLVLQGFPRARDLDRRIAAARRLAFHHAAEGALAGVAALKTPGADRRDAIFRKAAALVEPAGYRLDLGWVFVQPAYRGQRIGTGLCRQLMASVPGAGVFATTRTDNRAMQRVLEAQGFRRAGRPYPRRDEELALYLRFPGEPVDAGEEA